MPKEKIVSRIKVRLLVRGDKWLALRHVPTGLFHTKLYKILTNALYLPLF